MLQRIGAVDAAPLPGALPATLEGARRIAERWSLEEDWYWLLFDPLGVGFYAMFSPTDYCDGFLLNRLATRLRAHQFVEASDQDRYVGMVCDYGRIVRPLHERTCGQAKRGIHMARPHLERAIPLIEGFRTGAHATLTPDASRLERDDEALRAQVTAAAPAEVCIGQYPSRAEAYATLVRMHTTLGLLPTHVHEIGLERIAAIPTYIQAMLNEVGFAGTPTDCLRTIEDDPRWRATGEEAIGAVFQRYIDRIAANFNVAPEADHAAAPLPASLTKSMTFGCYPGPARRNLGGSTYSSRRTCGAGRSTFWARDPPLNRVRASFPLATQNKSRTLHPLRRKAFANAFNEGWAEYAADLAGEMGMYPQPEDSSAGL